MYYNFISVNHNGKQKTIDGSGIKPNIEKEVLKSAIVFTEKNNNKTGSVQASNNVKWITA